LCLLEHGDDLAVGKAGLLHGTSSRKDTRKFHFWRLLMGGGITRSPSKDLAAQSFLSASAHFSSSSRLDTFRSSMKFSYKNNR
ncbi:hypothetical protein, partial [Xanthomonas phaseoli]|uniref:hypothetical protein n=1 Tax=Xanthomonas phaseoli TaxID=1985254 RepID=UPI001939567C